MLMENSKSYIFNFTSQEDNPIQFYLMFVLLFFYQSSDSSSYSFNFFFDWNSRSRIFFL